MVENKGGLSWSRLEKIALIYFAIPVFIFLLFWINAPFNLLFAGLTALSLYKTFARKKQLLQDDEFRYRAKEVLGIAIFTGILAFVIGVGGWMPQSADYEQANYLFSELSPAHWPLGYQFSDGKTVDIVYYFGYHLIPASLGTFAGHLAIDITSFLLASIGLWLGLVLLGQYFKLPSWTLILLFGFSGLSFIGNLFQDGSMMPLGDPFMGFHAPVLDFYTSWALPLKNISALETLYFAVHHLITPLVLLPLVLRAVDKMEYDCAFAWLAIGAFWSPLTTLGVGVLVLWKLRHATFRKLFAFQNIGLSLGLLLPIAVFYSTRIFPDKILFLGNYLELKNYLMFACLEGGVWWLFVSPKFWKDSRFWSVVTLFFILSFFTMGQSCDLFYRIYLAPQIFVFAIVIRSMLENPGTFRVTLFSAVYLLGALAPATILINQFGNKRRPPLSEECRYEYHGYISNMDRIAKQFLGDNKANLFSQILLKPPPQPIQLHGTFKECLICKRVLGSKSVWVKNSEQTWLCLGSFGLYLNNPFNKEAATIHFRIENETASSLDAVIAKRTVTDKRVAWRYHTLIERLTGNERVTPEVSQGKFQIKFEKSRTIQIPAGGCGVTLKVSLSTGLSEILLYLKDMRGLAHTGYMFKITNFEVNLASENVLRNTSKGLPPTNSIELQL